MAQHFLLSSQAKTLNLLKIAKYTEKQAESYFRKLRWANTNGKPVCPRCGSLKHYDLKGRSVWKCKECHKQFSVTSGTLFAGHKLPLRTYLFAIALFSNEAKGMSALKLSRDLKVQYKTAFVLLHKIREALLETRDEETLMNGTCEIDGAYVNGYVRPENKKEDRIDRRLYENQNPKKRCIIVVRQRYGKGTEYVGSKRTLTFILKNENSKDIMKIANNIIEKGSEVHADESDAYNPLHAKYNMKRVNHSVEYYSEEGACSNQAESYFARFRRFQEGQIHKMDNLYLLNYANEMAYREDTRRMSNGEIFNDISEKCMKTLQSNEWTGYWQGNHRVSERLESAA